MKKIVVTVEILHLIREFIEESFNISVMVQNCGYSEYRGHHCFRVVIKKRGESKIIAKPTSEIEGDEYIFRSYRKALEAGILYIIKESLGWGK